MSNRKEVEELLEQLEDNMEKLLRKEELFVIGMQEMVDNGCLYFTEKQVEWLTDIVEKYCS